MRQSDSAQHFFSDTVSVRSRFIPVNLVYLAITCRRESASHRRHVLKSFPFFSLTSIVLRGYFHVHLHLEERSKKNIDLWSDKFTTVGNSICFTSLSIEFFLSLRFEWLMSSPPMRLFLFVQGQEIPVFLLLSSLLIYVEMNAKREIERESKNTYLNTCLGKSVELRKISMDDLLSTKNHTQQGLFLTVGELFVQWRVF